MGWTDWRKLANQKYWSADALDYEGPTVYELGIGGPNYGNIKPMYVGETANEKKRLADYARSGSHLWDLIDKALKGGYILYYRAQAMPSKAAAKRMQDNLLLQYEYPWNRQLNTQEED